MSQIEALTQCLILALTAPNDEKSDQASELAEKIAFGLSVDQVRSELDRLKNLMEAGTVPPQNTANKTKKIINAHFESSNATERQGA